MFVPGYDEASARTAVAASLSYSEALRCLGLRPAGGNHKLFRRYVDEIWKIPTEHFDQDRVRTAALRRRTPTPLSEILVEGSSYHRRSLKERLYEEGLKTRSCEMCGQEEMWRGARMSLILDHINGVPDDNRLANLRIVCANCNATLDTHCGRKNLVELKPRVCRYCGREFRPKRSDRRYCSWQCGIRNVRAGQPRPGARKVERPSYDQLREDVSQMSMLAVGRKYGVSDNAVRKWLRSYEAQQAGEPRDDSAETSGVERAR
jgi:hypothetical protein